jgi:antitoxin component HigA of HigAB toxin-antitoxin module
LRNRKIFFVYLRIFSKVFLSSVWQKDFSPKNLEMSQAHAYLWKPFFPITTVKQSPTMTQHPPAVPIPSPEALIVQHLEEEGRKPSWLADRIGISRSHLHNMLKSPEPWKKRLTPELREKINQVLKTNY